MLLLVQLPDLCLLAILERMANEPRSLFSAARAHSKLHQTAVLALRNISTKVRSQGQLHSLLLYLGKKKQQEAVQRLRLWGIGAGLQLRQLPCQLKLDSLDISSIDVQLQPGNGFVGVMQSQKHLKKLRLSQVVVLGEELQLSLLDGNQLQHLELAPALPGIPYRPFLAIEQLQKQQQEQLTYLELAGVPLKCAGQDINSLQFLAAFDQLLDLRLMGSSYYDLPTGVLAKLTKLQRLELTVRSLAVGVLPELEQLQQLDHLVLGPCQWQQGPPSGASFAALTASSKLRDLGLLGFQCAAEGAWESMFPAAGKHLPQLKRLSWDNGTVEQVPKGSSLVRCCPELVMFNARMPCSSLCGVLLSPLTALKQLSILVLVLRQLQPADHSLICRLTGLKILGVTTMEQSVSQLPLWELSSLQQLQFLAYSIPGLQQTCLFSEVREVLAPRPICAFY
jgi:Leucine-rich repeat (LRR) protein